MYQFLSYELNAFVLVIIYISSANCLHTISKRYQIPSLGSNVGPQQRSIRDSIVDRFHINPNTIIRTHDSRGLGAKYLNETELPSNEDCLYWCWETSPCNLAVYEEKHNRGRSCYLFDCGPNEDFRCKFTAHNFYSSSILQINRHPFDLSQWGSQVQHEKELTKLRVKEPYVESTVSPLPRSSTSSVRNLIPPSMVPTTTVNTLLFQKTSHCLHYQFECRNSSECIAIYNVCDGIPQCSDASDEAIDLECHKSRFNAPINQKPNNAITQSANSGQTSNDRQTDIKETQKSNPIYPQIIANKGSQVMSAYNYPKTVDSENGRTAPDEQTMGAKKHNLSPSGELGVRNNYNSQYRGPWNQYYQQNDGYNAPDNRLNSAGYLVEPEYLNGYSNRDSTNAGSYWPAIGRQQSYDLSDQMISPGSQTYLNIPNKPQTNAADEWPQTSSNSNGYDSNYYEHISRTRPNKPESTGRVVAHEMTSNAKSVSNLKKLENNSVLKTKQNSTPHRFEDKLSSKSSDDSNKPKLYNNPQTSYSHISSNKGYVKSPSIVAVSYMHDSNQQSGRETNSAVIALSLGLCVTILLIVLVGCRMKSFKRKIARRGRPLAHDADYLVNGMYL